MLFALFFNSALAADPAFDVASVKISKTGVRREVIQTAPGSLTMRNVPLRTCIDWAYGVDEYQVKGPDWITAERYEIIAKAGDSASPEELRLMLQALLAERFQLKFHRDSKTMQVYLLSVAKGGPKFQESDSDGEPAMGPSKKGPAFGVSGQRIPMSQVTRILSKILQAPILDQTGLTKKYDMSIDPSAYITRDGQTGDVKTAGGFEEIMNALFTGLQEQLGLKLESKKTPMDLLIIDHAERVPSEN